MKPVDALIITLQTQETVAMTHDPQKQRDNKYMACYDIKPIVIYYIAINRVLYRFCGGLNKDAPP